jgi:hypothetical protein
MKGSVFLVVAFVICSFGLPAQCKPNTNGFYFHELGDKTTAFIRFFDDGQVLVTTSTNNNKEMLEYFTLERKEMMLHGKYKWKKCSGSFTVKGDTGEQHFELINEGETLNVTVTDKQSGKVTLRKYFFYEGK